MMGPLEDDRIDITIQSPAQVDTVPGIQMQLNKIGIEHMPWLQENIDGEYVRADREDSTRDIPPGVDHSQSSAPPASPEQQEIITRLQDQGRERSGSRVSTSDFVRGHRTPSVIQLPAQGDEEADVLVDLMRQISSHEMSIPTARLDSVQATEEPLDQEPQEVGTATWELKKHINNLDLTEREDLFRQKNVEVLVRGQPDRDGKKWLFTNAGDIFYTRRFSGFMKDRRAQARKGYKSSRGGYTSEKTAVWSDYYRTMRQDFTQMEKQMVYHGTV